MLLSDLILSLVAPAILVALAVLFLRRKLHREFVFFFVYMLYAVIFGALPDVIAARPTFFFWLYWITEAVGAVLALLVLGEVFHRLFALPYAMYRWFRFLLPATVLVILNIAILEMVFRPFGRGLVGRLVSAIYWFDLGVYALEGTILLLIVGLTLVFPVRWRQYELGILTGFGIYASVSMFADLLRFLGGSRFDAFFRYGPPIAYILAALIWLHAFLFPPQSPPRSQMDFEEVQAIIRRSRRFLEKIEKVFGLRRFVFNPPA